jgi:hypothetical protein
MRIERGQRTADVESPHPRAFQRTAIRNGSRRRTVSVNAIRAAAQHGDVFSGNLFRTGQRELLIAAARAAIAHFHRNFSAGDQAHR